MDQPSAKPMTKTQVLTALAERTGMEKKEVENFLEQLRQLIGENLSEQGPGVFTLPGMLKIRRVHKPAVPERRGINPFTKEEQTFKAKPATNTVKVNPLKGLKDLV